MIGCCILIERGAFISVPSSEKAVLQSSYHGTTVQLMQST